MKFIQTIAIFTLFFTVIVGVFYTWNRMAPETSRTTAEQKPNMTSYFYKLIGDFDLSTMRVSHENLSEAKYAVEIKTTNSNSEAEKLLDMYQNLPFDMYFMPTVTDGKILYRVRSGLFDSAEKARAHQRQLAEKNIKGRVVEVL